MSVEREIKRVTTKALHLLKQKRTKITALTAYDFLTASILDKAGIDVVLVGDSLGNVFQGNDTTLSVTMDEMIYHTKSVAKGINRAMIVVDMPFMSYQSNWKDAIYNAGRIMKETPATAIKLEGGKTVADTVKKITEVGIPVMGHVGLTPQSIHQFGSYKARGRNKEEAERIIEDAKVLEESGVFALVLEKIPAELAKKISEMLSVPTIGIGAGNSCDGQILVTPDMLGLNIEFNPRFVRYYANLSDIIQNAVKKYIEDVKTLNFPSQEESY